MPQTYGVCNEINVIGDWPSNGESYYLLDIKNTTPKMYNILSFTTSNTNDFYCLVKEV